MMINHEGTPLSLILGFSNPAERTAEKLSHQPGHTDWWYGLRQFFFSSKCCPNRKANQQLLGNNF